MKPYFQDAGAGVTIYHGDCRELLPHLVAEAVITDPVWPNPSPLLAGSAAPYELFAQMCTALPAQVQRLVVQIGCNSDPRFLGPVPARLKFFRVCWLSVVPCHFRGRVLYSGDVAYVFGVPPVGTGIIPGECSSNEKPVYPRRVGRNRNPRVHEETESRLPHPAVRKLKHVKWLVKHFAGASVIDPFMGSGTTLLACQDMGVPCIGVELKEQYCELAVKRLSQRAIFEAAAVGGTA